MRENSVYSYGATGMREKAVVTQGGTTKTTESVWEGGRLAAERDDQTTLWRYTYAPDGTPLAVTKGFWPSAVTYAYHTDAQGSVVAITDPAGTVVARYRYDAFGAVTYTGGSDPALAARNPLRYRGYYLDAATGLYYLPARYYDPATARFLSQDPAPPSAGDPLTLNAYAYCVGDPVNLEDPTGAIAVEGSGVLSKRAGAIAVAHQTADKEMRRALSRRYPLPIASSRAMTALSRIGGLGAYSLAGAGLCAILDGPLPFGDVAAVGVLAGGGAAAGSRAAQVVGDPGDEVETVKRTLAASHHIVAANAWRAAPARAVLARYGMSVQDVANRVSLTANTKVANTLGTNIHSTLHTRAYYGYVNAQLAGCQSNADVYYQLARIQGQLAAGVCPY